MSEKPCTCADNRRLNETEAVLLFTPAGRLHVFARDCPIHGIRELQDVKDESRHEDEPIDTDA